MYRAEPDGYTIGIWNLPGFIAAQFALDTQYDLREVSWFNRAARSVYILAVNADSDYETLEDVQNAETFKLSQTAPGATGWIVDVVASKELGINNKEVTGYDGSQEQAAAVLRGEVDGFFMAKDSPSMKQPIKEGDFRGIIILAEDPPEYAPDIPTASELGYEQLAGQIALHRMLGAPPELPENKLKILSDSTLEAMNSDEMQQWSKDQARPLSPLEGGYQEANELVDSLFSTMQKYEDTFKQAMQ
jgi:tripartite-type tricarboxylate transporter receptor subunit TctC